MIAAYFVVFLKECRIPGRSLIVVCCLARKHDLGRHANARAASHYRRSTADNILWISAILSTKTPGFGVPHLGANRRDGHTHAGAVLFHRPDRFLGGFVHSIRKREKAEKEKPANLVGGRAEKEGSGRRAKERKSDRRRARQGAFSPDRGSARRGGRQGEVRKGSGTTTKRFGPIRKTPRRTPTIRSRKAPTSCRMTTPTRRAQLCRTPIGFFRACSKSATWTCASLTISATMRSSSHAPAPTSGVPCAAAIRRRFLAVGKVLGLVRLRTLTIHQGQAPPATAPARPRSGGGS